MPRYYSSTATETELVGSISSSSINMDVASTVGFPVSYPYTLILEIGTESEEIVDVTAASGNTLTVTRGRDGSSAVAHSAGAKVIHGVTARDYREMQEHIAATTDVHGLAAGSQFVGTTDTQTLSNKTLSNPTITGGSISGASIAGLNLSTPSFTGGGSWTGGPSLTNPTLITPTIASFINAKHDHSNDANGGTITAGGGGTNLPVVMFGAQASQNNTTIRWASPVVNNGPIWNSSSDTRFTAPIAGRYLVGATTRYSSIPDAGDYYDLEIKKNGSTVVGGQTVPGSTSRSMYINATAFLALNAGDYITFSSSGQWGFTSYIAYNGFAVCLAAT